MLVEERLAAHRQEHHVFAVDLRRARQKVEVRSHLGSRLVTDLLDLKAHEVAELPVRNRRNARVAHVHFAAADADAGAPQLELWREAGPAGADVPRVVLAGGHVRDVEGAAFPGALEGDRRP